MAGFKAWTRSEVEEFVEGLENTLSQLEDERMVLLECGLLVQPPEPPEHSRWPAVKVGVLRKLAAR